MHVPPQLACLPIILVITLINLAGASPYPQPKIPGRITELHADPDGSVSWSCCSTPWPPRDVTISIVPAGNPPAGTAGRVGKPDPFAHDAWPDYP